MHSAAQLSLLSLTDRYLMHFFLVCSFFDNLFYSTVKTMMMWQLCPPPLSIATLSQDFFGLVFFSFSDYH